MFKKYSGKLYCFSPPVMLATFLIEISGAIYTVVRYKMTTTTRLISATLALLAIFQLAEYNVCEIAFGSQATWSRVGFIAIAMLPPLGIHLVNTMSKRNWHWAVWLGYASGITFACLIGFSRDSFTSHICAGNYAIFQLTAKLGGAFFTYYYGLLFLAIGMGLYFCLSAKQSIRESLIFHTFGYLCFLLPTGVTNAVNPTTISGIPSIMCGFAVIFALALIFGILPRVSQRK